MFGVFLVEVSVAGSLHSSGLKTTGTPQGRRRFIRPSAAAPRHRHTRLSLASFDRSQLRATPNSSPSATSKHRRLTASVFISKYRTISECTATMPGILPMKVIKVGTSAQSRIAQACDRCRSKKIRCDGITPCCTQCSNVGFECKTSDKLSRRAFPRGYTESLEERVRALEAEVKELKDLVDEKDEKIDILSRISSGSRRTSNSMSSPSPRSQSKTTTPSTECREPKDEDTFRVQQSPCLLDAEHADSYFMGASSGRAFVGW